MINKLAYYRNKYGMTQEELARDLNVRRETIIRIENNKNIPSLKLALQIQYLFADDINDIFQLSDDEINEI